MATFSWEYVFKPREAQWWVSIIFILVGIGCGLVLPFVFSPTAPPGYVRTTGAVIEIMESEEGMYKPLFEYDLPGTPEKERRRYTSPVSSNRTMYEVGDTATLVLDLEDADVLFIEGDRDMAVVVWILHVLGTIFFVIGAAVLVLMAMRLPDYVVHTIGGMLGALSFGIPATLTLPLLRFAHLTRPNFFFRTQDPFTSESFFIGILFSILGVITTIATVILARYQLKHKTFGWSWSYNSDDHKKKEDEKIGL